MHCLIGCFAVDQTTMDPPPPLPQNISNLVSQLPPERPTPYEEIEGVRYWRIEIKLS